MKNFWQNYGLNIALKKGIIIDVMYWILKMKVKEKF